MGQERYILGDSGLERWYLPHNHAIESACEEGSYKTFILNLSDNVISGLRSNEVVSLALICV
jgi:hypothetical protein